MKAKNQIFIISGIAAILIATALLGNYNVQTVKAQNFGRDVSDIATDDPHSLGAKGTNTCDDNCNDGAGKHFGEIVSELAKH